MKKFATKYIVAFFLLVVVVRLINILGFPLYLDEGIYISWAKLFQQSEEFAYVGLNDGKTPLYMWAVASVSGWFSSSWLAARVISVIAGALTAVVWSLISLQLFGVKEMKFYMLFSLIVPYLFFIERMAFVDSLLTFFVSAAFLLWIVAKNLLDKDRAHHLALSVFLSSFTGLILSLAYMTKTSARIFLVAHVVLGLIWMVEYLLKRAWAKIFIVLAMLGIMFVTYREFIGYMRVGAARFWLNITAKEYELTYSLSEIFERLRIEPQLYFDSISKVFNYFWLYLAGVSILAVISIYVLYIQRSKIKKLQVRFTHSLWLFVYIGIVVCGSILAGRVMATRYIYPIIPALLCFSTIGAVWLSEQKNRWFRMNLIIGMGITALLSLYMIIKPNDFPYAGGEDNFVHKDLSALGLREISTSIDRENSIVGVTGIWGVKDGSVIYLQEQGIEAFGIETILSQTQSENGECHSEFVSSDSKCWELHFDTVNEGSKRDMYYYLTDTRSEYEFLLELPEISVVKEFVRPSGLRTYLIKVEEVGIES